MRPRDRVGGLVGRLALLVAVALVGYAVAGLTGLLVAGAAAIAGQVPAERPGAPVAMAACVLLAAAGLATVLEAAPGPQSLSLAFPLERELAGNLGAAAGILLLAAVVTASVAERSDRPRERAPVAPSGDVLPPLPVVVAGGAVLVAALSVRVLAAPAPHAASLDGMVASIAGGRALTVDEVGLVPPGAPVLAALWPGGGAAALVALGVVLVVLAGVLALRSAPALGEVSPLPLALAAGALAAVLPAMWLLDLAAALAALVAITSVLLAHPSRLSTGRGLAAGALAATGLLARPDTVVLGPLLVAWVLLDRPPGAGVPTRQARAAAAVGAGWSGVLFAWMLVVRGEGDGWNPLRSFGDHGSDGLALGGVVMVGALLLDLGALVLAATAVRRMGAGLVRLLPLAVLPLWCVLTAVVLDRGGLGLLSWGAPFVVVLAAWQLLAWAPSSWARPPRGHPLAQPEVRSSS